MLTTINRCHGRKTEPENFLDPDSIEPIFPIQEYIDIGRLFETFVLEIT